jgi:hypothetical protein
MFTNHGLGTYYSLEDNPELKLDIARRADRFAYLDRDGVRSRLTDFDDGHTASESITPVR